MASRTTEYLKSIVSELRKLPSEIEWVEFKCNNKDPQMIGEYISALSNSAALCEKPFGYVVWGIDDGTHDIKGTTFDWQNAKKGNEQLEAWLTRLCNPRVNFRFYDVLTDDGKVVLLEIPAAENQPLRFSGEEYIRIASNKKYLKEFPQKERELWKTFDTVPFELKIALENKTEDEVVALLDYSRYYDKMGIPVPRNRSDILEDFSNEKFVKKNTVNNWDITNIGAILIGKDLKKFDSLTRKTVRVIWYKNNTRLETIREKEFVCGYAFAHEEITQYIMTIIPQQEIIEGATRRSEVSYPEIAIRELLANMIIHQDLEHHGTNPMVEVFSDRIEFSNAGAPLINNQENQFTKVVLFGKLPFDVIPKEEKIRTVYMQACLAYVNYGAISNIDVRNIFGLEEKESYKSSRLIKETVDAKLIKVVDETTAPRYMKYIPIWA